MHWHEIPKPTLNQNEWSPWPKALPQDCHPPNLYYILASRSLVQLPVLLVHRSVTMKKNKKDAVSVNECKKKRNIKRCNNVLCNLVLLVVTIYLHVYEFNCPSISSRNHTQDIKAATITKPRWTIFENFSDLKINPTKTMHTDEHYII